MTTPTTLLKFTLLPPELRNIIWEISLPEPRVLDIYPASASQKILPQQGLRFANLYTEPPPALAAVCRESRSLVCHHYRPLTLGRTTKYVDLNRDMLLLESYLFGRDLMRTLLFMSQIPLIKDNLQSLAFGTSFGVHTGVWHPVLGWKKLTRGNMGKFLQRLGAFPVLERLVFMVHQEMQFEVGSRLPPPRVLHGNRDCRPSTPPATPRRSQTPTSPSGPLDPAFYLIDGHRGSSKGHFYRVPWTAEKPWLPHANDIAYYASPVADDDDNGIDAARPRKDAGASNRAGKLVPTNDDWVRFRRSFRRAMETGLELGLADPATNSCPLRKRKRMTEVGGEEEDRNMPLQTSNKVRKLVMSEGGCKLLAIEGASLVWRYSLPT
ncbi:hypothetical protein M406DRAFT_341807 [Cryphonectria parasitica EP155]|uniref:2EXR domain-containing protein n=1 Tax=Cryphonectria parasitica (strain ATCC 38755 / EP155) TaxID=660469 RepID=A0A9P5CM89_CRYP1|nr:uncharacterized protein M406DRAFT_341807 [Cryphonectria parasitica EP155]KAF3762620.1 hypothetical protein M406DRAFT_341807 [Cryphonectria parasitica EP155]